MALAAAALLLLTELQSSLTREVDSNARQAASEVAKLADQHELPNPLPFGPGTLSVQVLGPHGSVVSASALGDRLVPLLPPALARSIARSGQVVQMPAGRPASRRRCGWWRCRPSTARPWSRPSPPPR